MYGVNRPAEHKPETILAAALAVFRDNGVRASTAQIAAAAGVSNGTLFNYFPTKQDLIDQLYLATKAELASAISDVDPSLPTRQQMREVWDRWIEWAEQRRDAYAVMNLLHEAGLVSDTARVAGLDLIHVPMRVLRTAHQADELADLPLPYLATLVQQQLDQAVAAQLKDREAAIAFDVLWNGITETSSPTRKRTS